MTSPDGTPPAPAHPPSRVRYSILALLCLLAMITYMDRAMYGSAKADLMAAVGRHISDFYLVTSCFQLAYALFEVPNGWLGDRFGPRKALLRIVVWWSAFVALTGAVGLTVPGVGEFAVPFVAFLAIQFCFGMGEAGAFPNISRSLYNWFPVTQRGLAQGTIWLSARFMGGLTPLVWTVLTVFVGLAWRENLWLFAGLAGLWVVVFFVWFRDRPADHPAVNDAERELIATGAGSPPVHSGVPWRTIVSSRNLWALCGMYMVTNFNWYFLIYNLPDMLKSQFPHLNASREDKLILGLVSGAPLLIGMFGCLSGGLLTDWYVRRTGDRKWGRRTFGMIGYGLAGVAYLAAALTISGNFWVFAACAIAVGFCNDLVMSPAWATAQDIGGRYSAIVSGAMNMIGNLGTVLGIQVSGAILKAFGDRPTDGYVICFVLYAVIYALGVVSWRLVDPTKPVVADDHETAAGASS